MVINSRIIDEQLFEIISRRNLLRQLEYSDERYDRMEDELHELEDRFATEHGDAICDILQGVHREYFPTDKVLSPVSYLAQQYREVGENDYGPIYDIPHNEGVQVTGLYWPGKTTKLVLAPNPLRLLLNIDEHTREEVWSINF